MSVSRRVFLTSGAATAAIVVAGGAGWALTRRAGSAREPWRRAASGFGDARLDVLAYAILAPNPHNMQPWRIELDGDSGVSVYCDLARRLPHTDPLDRQITIGFGCFLELLRQAAAEKGFAAQVTPFPEGEPHPRLDARRVAAITLQPDTGIARDPLFGVILDRRTNRQPFDTGRAVSAGALSAITAASVPGVTARATAEPGMVGQLRRLTLAGWETEWATPATRRESIAVTRIGKREINSNPDGLALEGAMMEALNVIGVLTRDQLDDPRTRGYQESLSFYSRACETAAAFVWSLTGSNTRRDQLEAGRAWVRMQMAANAAGVAFHPLSQVLQEFPEMTSLYRDTHDLLDARDGQVVQMLARLGHAPTVAPAARWPLEAKLVPA